MGRSFAVLHDPQAARLLADEETAVRGHLHRGGASQAVGDERGGEPLRHADRPPTAAAGRRLLGRSERGEIGDQVAEVARPVPLADPVGHEGRLPHLALDDLRPGQLDRPAVRLQQRHGLARLLLDEAGQDPSVPGRQDGRPIPLDDLARGLQNRLDHLHTSELAPHVRQVRPDLPALSPDPMTAGAAEALRILEQATASARVPFVLDGVSGEGDVRGRIRLSGLREPGSKRRGSSPRRENSSRGQFAGGSRFWNSPLPEPINRRSSQEDAVHWLRLTGHRLPLSLDSLEWRMDRRGWRLVRPGDGLRRIRQMHCLDPRRRLRRHARPRGPRRPVHRRGPCGGCEVVGPEARPRHRPGSTGHESGKPSAGSTSATSSSPRMAALLYRPEDGAERTLGEGPSDDFVAEAPATPGASDRSPSAGSNAPLGEPGSAHEEAVKEGHPRSGASAGRSSSTSGR